MPHRIDTTLRDFKTQLHRWLSCADEAKRRMSCVEVVVGDRPLLNNEEMVSEAVPGTEVLAFLSVKPVTCCSVSTSGCHPDDLRVVEIPDGVPAIWPGAFSGCSSLASVAIPDSVTEIREFAFRGCSSLASVSIPDSVAVIGGGAFHGCSSLASVTIPNSVTAIGVGAFASCCSLTSVAIPKSVTEIGPVAFKDCSSLATVIIPDSVSEIGHDAFAGCSYILAERLRCKVQRSR
ncbi:unnamed protein product [Effrenium voratum]|nr:unnamed protein product [Effrenium voratum]